MKSILVFIVVILLSGISLIAQQDTISTIQYYYDDAGNRTHREIIYYEGGLKSATVEDIEEEINESEKAIKVYPNPASRKLYVTLNDEAMEEENRKIILFDNLGKQLFNMDNLQDINEIDVSTLLNGTYILRLIYGHKHKEWIIIKD